VFTVRISGLNWQTTTPPIISAGLLFDFLPTAIWCTSARKIEVAEVGQSFAHANTTDD
jgi:hypothetical protein